MTTPSILVSNSIKIFFFRLQEDANRGKPNWEHLADDLHVLITVEDTENRAKVKLQRAVEEVQKLLVPVSGARRDAWLTVANSLPFFSPRQQQAEGEDELKKRQLMELAIINGTYRDSSTKAAAAGKFQTSSFFVPYHCRLLSRIIKRKIFPC